MKPTSDVHAKNQAAIDLGRAEIEGRKFVHHGPPPAGNQSQNQNQNYGAPQYDHSYTGNESHNPQGLRPSVSGSQIEPEGRGLGGFMRKMKTGPMASDRTRGKGKDLTAVNE